MFHSFEDYVSRGIILSQQGVIYRVLISNISALWTKRSLIEIKIFSKDFAYALSVDKSNIKLRSCEMALKLNTWIISF